MLALQLRTHGRNSVAWRCVMKVLGPASARRFTDSIDNRDGRLSPNLEGVFIELEENEEPPKDFEQTILYVKERNFAKVKALAFDGKVLIYPTKEAATKVLDRIKLVLASRREN